MNMLGKKCMLFFVVVVGFVTYNKGFLTEKQCLESKAKKIVVIGTGAAGIGFVQEILDQKSLHFITWISSDIDDPYDRTKLDDIVSTKVSKNKVILFDKKFENIELILGKKVLALDREKKLITLSDKSTYPYDYIFLATGSTPITPVFEGYEQNKSVNGIFNFYTLQDAQKIDQYIKNHRVKKAVILGCGISGLEAAEALHKRGIEVILIDRNDHILAHSLDASASLVIENSLKQQVGVSWHPKVSIKKIIEKDGQLQAVELNDGTKQVTSLLINTIGVKPNNELAKEAGIKIQNNALVVDKTMKTSDPLIYAGGDIVLVYDKATGKTVKSSKWGDAMKQGKIAALNILGIHQLYEGAFIGYRTSFFGMDFIMSGVLKNYPSTYTTIEKKGIDKQGKEFYHKVVLDNDCVKGFLMINNMSQAKRLRQSLEDKIPFNVQRFLKRYNEN